MEESPITVLYVDDEVQLLQIGKIFLEKFENIRVNTAPSARQALQDLSSGSYDAIVSDYQMPEMDGIAFLKEVRRDLGDIPFILFTGRGREEIVIQAIDEGVDFYLQKGGEPMSQFAELAHKIRQAVRRKEAEQNLRRSERRYRSIVQDQTEMIVRFSPDGTITFANEAYQEYFLPILDLDGIIGKNIRQIMQIKNYDQVESFLSSLTPQAPTREKERMISGRDGEKHWQLYTVRSIFDENGKKVEYQVVGRDITGRKRIEEKLLQVLEENRKWLEEERIISEFSRFLLKATSAGEVLDRFGEIIFPKSGADYLVMTKLDQSDNTVGIHSLKGSCPFLAQMSQLFKGTPESFHVPTDFITGTTGRDAPRTGTKESRGRDLHSFTGLYPGTGLHRHRNSPWY